MDGRADWLKQTPVHDSSAGCTSKGKSLGSGAHEQERQWSNILSEPRLAIPVLVESFMAVHKWEI